MSAAVITEFAALLRAYLARTSDGKEATLKFAIGLYGVIGVFPATGGDGLTVATGGAAGAVGLNAVKAMPERSSGTKSGIKWSL